MRIVPTPNTFVPIAMFGSVIVYFILFMIFPKRKAFLISFFGAWLFLPVYTYVFEGVPDLSKIFVVCMGIMSAVFIFDWQRIISFRPRLIDIPIVLWCLLPFASSYTNKLGLYDGFSEALGQTVLWGIPYFLGRIYFNNWDDMRALAKAIVISGLVYVPFLLYEMRFAPRLHNDIYGYHQAPFDQAVRFGFYRPTVFMRHGLMVAFWMMTVTLLCVWLWHSKTFRKFAPSWLPFEIPFGVIPLGFGFLTIFLVSANAWLWMSGGLFITFLIFQLKARWPIGILMLFIIFYVFTQGSGLWPTELTVDFATGLFGSERAQSLEFRYDNEELLTEKARERALFGWAGWGRQLVVPEWGSPTIPDSLWVIQFGKFGAIGLGSLMLTIFLPAIVLMFKYNPRIWGHPNLAPVVGMCLILILYMVDGLLNQMVNPLFMVINGAILGTFSAVPKLATTHDKDPQSPSEHSEPPSPLQPATGD